MKRLALSTAVVLLTCAAAIAAFIGVTMIDTAQIVAGFSRPAIIGRIPAFEGKMFNKYIF